MQLKKISKVFFFYFLLTTLIFCNKKKYAKLVYIKKFDFGVIRKNDSIEYSLKIKNISDVDYKIKQIATSCGCTFTTIKDSVLKKNESLKIKIKYVSKPDDSGIINNSIVIDGNTNPPFTTHYMTGFVK